MRKLVILLVLIAAFAGAWFVAGRGAGPEIEIVWPTTAIGQNGQLVLLLNTPNGELSELDVMLEQGTTRHAVFNLETDGSASITTEADGRLKLTRPIGKQHTPALEAGNARILVAAGRPTFMGLQQKKSSTSAYIAVRLVPPQVAVFSTHHYVNHGGSEMVVYGVSGASQTSGVRVGELEYPGFPATGAGIATADSSLRVAFFALQWNQDPNTPISVFARDDAGNEGVATVEHRTFAKVFRKSRITVDDKFLARVVPAILQNSTEFRVNNPADLLGSYVQINRELRKQNDSVITALAAQTSPTILWEGPFKQLTNTAVEAGFADQRSYFYQDKEIDQQVHLGFDLASTSAAPVLAANNGKVLHAGWLGIYGNCVILDHGMGLQSLYGHLSSVQVKVGDMVKLNDTLGRSGTTGLAGGDHLHFTMLLGGRAVTPVDWWSNQWVEDRIVRKLRDAGR